MTQLVELLGALLVSVVEGLGILLIALFCLFLIANLAYPSGNEGVDYRIQKCVVIEVRGDKRTCREWPQP